MKIYKPNATKPFMKLLVYSKPGIGKTYLAATAQDHPDMRDVLYANVESGLLTVQNKDVAAVDLGRTEDGAPNGRIVADLEELVWALVTKKEGFENYKTLVIDSASELQARDLEDIVAEAKKRPRKPGQAERNIDEVYQEDYGKDTKRLARIFRMLRDAPLHVIVTAIVRQTFPKGKDDGDPIEVSPALTASIKESLMASVDFVWFLYKDQDNVRTLLTEEKGIYRAKTRLPEFAETIGSVVKNPSLPELYTKLCKSLGK